MPASASSAETRLRRVRRAWPIHYHDHQLVELVGWIESDGLLRTDEQLMAEMLRELGFRRRGKRIEDALARAIRRARA